MTFHGDVANVITHLDGNAEASSRKGDVRELCAIPEGRSSPIFKGAQEKDGGSKSLF